MEVYYQSSRCFGQHGINVDIALVEHANFGILELITHEVNVNAEAPRIYLDMALLKSAIQPSKLETRVNAMREPLLRLREVVNEQTILQTATKNAIIELLLGQLVIMEYNAEARSFVVGIGSSIVNCVCPAPTNLAPYKMVHKAQPPTYVNNFLSFL